jgi:PKHD-type hydroxylase
MWHLKKETVERWSWCQPYTKEGCDKIIDIGNSLLPKEIVVDASGNVVRSKNGTSCFLPINDDTRWIFETCSKHIIEINSKFFEYDLHYLSEMQFTVYDEDGDFVPKHLDTFYESTTIRKLSFMIQLSDPTTYEGNEHLLHFDQEPTISKDGFGHMTIYPSSTLNEVTPLKKGKRCVLMGWVVGPKFK